MNNYEVEFTKGAQKEFSTLGNVVRVRVAKAIDKLSLDPRRGNVRPMVGTKSWRLKVGEYRVIYDILDNKLIILIIRIKHRREVYRK